MKPAMVIDHQKIDKTVPAPLYPTLHTAWTNRP